MTRFRRLVRAELVRLLALVAALAVVTGASLAGQRYFYCEPMHRIALDECCAHHDDDAALLAAPHAEVASLDTLPGRCCEVRVFDSGDEGALSAPPAVAAAPLVGVLPKAPSFVLVGAAPRGARVDRDTRAGPPRRPGPLGWRTGLDVSLS